MLLGSHELYPPVLVINSQLLLIKHAEDITFLLYPVQVCVHNSVSLRQRHPRTHGGVHHEIHDY